MLPPRATASGTRRRLQEGALILFGERGYHGVSIREVAEAAGISVSSVYAHIAAKEDILVELVLLGHEEHNHRLRKALMNSAPDPAAQLRAVVTAHVAMHASYPLLTRVSNRELYALSPEALEPVMRIRHDSERVFLDVVERGVAAGEFTCEDPWMTVAAIGAMGIRVAEWFDPDGDRTIEQVAATYAEFALKLLS